MLTLAGVVAVVAAGVLVFRTTRPKAAAFVLPTEVVAKRDIMVTIEATGTVEPIDLVEVKSKASGQILKMPVEVGTRVDKGDLLALIDTVDVANQYAQARAALRAAEAKSEVSAAQKKRTKELYDQQIVTTTDMESATLDFANAQSALVKARTDLDNARQRREDTTVRAPVTGTILEQVATLGQVIASATSSASGGTTLLNMADLSRIRLRTLVSESDIGKVQPGLTATVTVDAFPNRPFEGQVEKIEPKAVVQQSVTMFPVLISLSNDQGLLLPGMNGEVTVMIEQRQGVTAVPLDAVRTVREMNTVATALGVNPDSARADLQKQIDERRAAFAARAGGDSAGAAGGGSGVAGNGPGTGTGGPGGRSGGTGGAGGWTRSGSGGTGGSGGPGSPGGRSGGTSATGARRAGGMAGTGGFAAGGAGDAAGGFGARAQFVFIKAGESLRPRLVRVGLSDYDYAEIVRGVQEGETVVLLNVAELQARRKQDQEQIRARMGNGLPGSQGSGTTRGTGGGRPSSGSGGSGGTRTGGGSR